MKISLMVLSAGSAAGKALPVTTAQFIIGRDPQCNLRPASAMISKRHCAVLVKDGDVFLRDFDSTNGTFVNEKQIKGEVPLKDGDVLKVGPLSFKVMIDAKPAAKTTPPPKPRTAALTDEEAAAALLAFDDDPGRTSTTETAEDAVPSGSTIMELPSFGQSGETIKLAEPENGTDDKKAANKKNPAQGAAQDAAKAILEKLKQGKRK